VLLVLVVVLFTIARIIGGRAPGNLSTGQQHRRERKSYRDAVRISRREQAAAPPTSEPTTYPGGTP
jgi:phosphate transport system permease protein